MGESSIQKGLNYGILASFMSIPFTGPIGLMGMGSCLITKIYRKMNSEGSQRRRFQRELINTLERERERQTHLKYMGEGAKMIDHYLANLSEEEYSRIREIEILEKEDTSLGFSNRKRNLEVKVKT